MGTGKDWHLNKIVEYNAGYGRDIGFHTDGELWATATTGTIHLWNASKLIKTIDIPGYIYGKIQFSSDGQYIYVGTWRINTQTFNKTLVLHNRALLIAGIDPDYDPRANQFRANHVEWTRDTKKLVINSVYRPSREINAKSDYDGPESQIIVLNAITASFITALEADIEFLAKCGLALSSQWIATGGEDVEVWDFNNGKPLQILESTAYCQCVNFSPDESYLATTHNDGAIYLWSTSDWLHNIRWQAHDRVVKGLVFHPSEPLVVTFGDDLKVKLWSLANSLPQLVVQITVEREINGLAFNPAGTLLYLIASYPSSAVRIYELT